MNTDELPIVLTSLKDVRERIKEEHKKTHALEQDRCRQVFIGTINPEIAKMTKITDLHLAKIPYELEENETLKIVEGYQVIGWTMDLIRENGVYRYIRFYPLMDHDYDRFKPS
jgi:hypothetical protein